MIFQFVEVFQVFAQGRVPRRVDFFTMQMKEFNGFFALFPGPKKCGVGSALGVGTECGLYSVHAGELVWTLMGRRWWMMRLGTRGGSCVLVGGACSTEIVLFGGMLQGDEVACCFQLVCRVSVTMQRQFQQFVEFFVPPVQFLDRVVDIPAACISWYAQCTLCSRP